MNWITSWLRDRDWANLQANATIVVAAIAIVVLLIFGLTKLFAGGEIRDTDQCQSIDIEGAWFSPINMCEFELPNGVQCYAVEFGDGGGLYCD